ncbi:HD domain-containing protein (plasmid) [Acidiphilium multivorum]|uniref:HD domain-containing protein n=1 Tax=Acidiphilium multivorum TaxID=62140 RepID=UPI001F4BF875|nr:HD domain-containing protein [Acidiphilium multivorum]UNC16165.1 HD domain-containing protein [Acidiphilium multivorum]
MSVKLTASPLDLDLGGVPLVEAARRFGAAAHGAIAQMRRYVAEPYFAHPVRVAGTIAALGYGDHVVAAALLHDVVEDTPVTITDLELRFGGRVAGLVHWVTNVATSRDGDRAARASINLRHIAAGPSEAQTIKAADILDNTPSIISHDPSFAAVYVPEKIATLRAMTQADRRIVARAMAACEAFQPAPHAEPMR